MGLEIQKYIFYIKDIDLTLVSEGKGCVWDATRLAIIILFPANSRINVKEC